MITSVNTNAVKNDIPEVLGTLDIQTVFAQLQMDLAKENKDSARTMIDNVKHNQEISKQYAQTIADLNGLNKDVLAKYKFPDNVKDLDAKIADGKVVCADYDKIIANAKAGTQKVITHVPNHGDQYALSDDAYKKFRDIVGSAGKGNFENFMRGDDNLHYMFELEGGKKEIEQYLHYAEVMRNALSLNLSGSFLSGELNEQTVKKMINSLQGLQEEYGTKNQTIMVQIQDTLGQYNAYTQGANAAVQQANNVLQSLARAS